MEPVSSTKINVFGYRVEVGRFVNDETAPRHSVIKFTALDITDNTGNHVRVYLTPGEVKALRKAL